jgi:hypothetical protein
MIGNFDSPESLPGTSAGINVTGMGRNQTDDLFPVFGKRNHLPQLALQRRFTTGIKAPGHGGSSNHCSPPDLRFFAANVSTADFSAADSRG